MRAWPLYTVTLFFCAGRSDSCDTADGRASLTLDPRSVIDIVGIPMDFCNAFYHNFNESL